MKFHPIFLLAILPACRQHPPAHPPEQGEKVPLPVVAAGENYWYQGKAEISSYAVVQERYGEQRAAGQVMVYANIPRRLDIRFETAFPHRILGWEESNDGKLLSKGTLKKTLLDAYWQHHDLGSAPLRAELNPGF